MSNLPGFILRNCMLWADKTSKLGQIGDITPPAPQSKMEEMRNAGMIKPREVDLGYEKLEFSFKMPSVDPQILKLFGLKIGVETSFMVTGALIDEDGGEHSAVLTIRGKIKGSDLGTWKPGDVSEMDSQVTVNYYKLEIDGEEIMEMDDFEYKAGGVSQTSGISNMLLIG